MPFIFFFPIVAHCPQYEYRINFLKSDTILALEGWVEVGNPTWTKADSTQPALLYRQS